MIHSKLDMIQVFFYPIQFDSKGETLSFTLIQGWDFQNYINLEFPKYSENESFDVFLNDIPIDSVQSIDDMGNWHVAFLVESQSEGTLTITGFDSKLSSPNLTPSYSLMWIMPMIIIFLLIIVSIIIGIIFVIMKKRK